MVTSKAEYKSSKTIFVDDSRAYLQSFGLNPADWHIERESRNGQIVFSHQTDRDLRLIGQVTHRMIERLTLQPIEFYPTS